MGSSPATGCSAGGSLASACSQCLQGVWPEAHDRSKPTVSAADKHGLPGRAAPKVKVPHPPNAPRPGTPTTPQQLKIPAALGREPRLPGNGASRGTVIWGSGNVSATAAGRFPSDGANGAGPGGRRLGPNDHPILTADSCFNAVYQSGVRVPPRSLAARHPWVRSVLDTIVRSLLAPGLCQTHNQYARIQKAGPAPAPRTADRTGRGSVPKGAS